MHYEQMAALQALDDDDDDDQVDSGGGGGGSSADDNDTKTAKEVKKALSKVPGLTDSQIQSLVDLEMSLANNDVQKGCYWEVENISFY